MSNHDEVEPLDELDDPGDNHDPGEQDDSEAEEGFTDLPASQSDHKVDVVAESEAETEVEDDELTSSQNFGIWVFMIPMIICSMEIVPGWGFIGLEWAPQTYYIIMIVAGLVAGVFMGSPAAAGALGGAVAGAWMSLCHNSASGEC
jgi:hypothetical protein